MKIAEKARIYHHLGLFKRDVPKVSENGIWVGNGQQYAHILPRRLEPKNLIDKGYASQLLALCADTRIKKRRSFHHLNSSQALAFSLFEPFRAEDMPGTPLKMVEADGKADFSEYGHIELETENANFDFFVSMAKNKAFFEVKYTESGFGSASDDERHTQKYREIHSVFLRGTADIDKEEFFRRYQP